MRNQSLIAWVKAQGLEGQDLDSEVDGLMSAKASAINNDGMNAQLELMAQEMGGEEAVKEHLRALYCISKDAECPTIDILDGTPVPFSLTVQKAGESVGDVGPYLEEIDQWLFEHGKIRESVNCAYVYYRPITMSKQVC